MSAQQQEPAAPSAAPSNQSSYARTPYTYSAQHITTPIGLINNGARISEASGAPSIFTSEPVQVLQLGQHGALRSSGPLRSTGPTQNERLFGVRSGGTWSETTTHELGRLQIVTMRQLQRALQHKITQNTRNPAGFWAAFHKLDRRGAQHLNLDDLIAAVRGFNLVASDELIKQLLHALDSDHDGVLSLAEFVAGMQSDNRTMELQREPQYGVSSRRHFRNIKFHHPLHNVAHLSTFHQFEEN